MKIKALIATVLTLGINSAAFAFTDYYPPERLSCNLTNNKLTCSDFNRNYLMEDTYTADFNKGEEMFHFGSAVAYFAQNEASIFFTYHDNDNKMVKLKTVNTSIKPNLTKGQWKRVTDDIYTCDVGYMSCPITNLPSHK